MPLRLDPDLTPLQLLPAIDRMFELSAGKILRLQQRWQPDHGTPVFTARGRYTSRGWTEWTQGFQFGSAILQFDATDDPRFLECGNQGTLSRMATHVSHVGVHDHGFNNLSTYGNLLRLHREGRFQNLTQTLAHTPVADIPFLELALKTSGAIQAARWTQLADGTGFIHSFNGPHSLFVDTIRSLRVLAVAHRLGHVLMGEQDARISLLRRLCEHTLNTARYNLYFGRARDAYDVRGRTAHEAVFNTASGVFRCPNSQQGFSPFTTWTRGLAWALCGFAEQLEFLPTLHSSDLDAATARLPRLETSPNPRTRHVNLTQPNRTPETQAFLDTCLAAAQATADFYLENCCTDGIPLWDTGAPNVHRLGDYLHRPSDPYNDWEPFDSSAAAIAAQGLLRLGNYLSLTHPSAARDARRYRQAALTLTRTLLTEPYLSTNPRHEGLLLHSVYHRPNGWDFVARGQKVPNGESSMWGDYHLRELALLVRRLARQQPYLTFFGCCPDASTP